jgi:radical SAM/Cys-rich protein
MNAFLRTVEEHGIPRSEPGIRRGVLVTLQVNMGNLCNQRCIHCHVGASPEGKKLMRREVVDDVLALLSRAPGLILDVTGGAPEMNPHFEHLILSAADRAREIIVRSNLTVFLEPGNSHWPSFLAERRVHLICSLPCYTDNNVDRQRGRGAFVRSIAGLRLLNARGYGRERGLPLDLVYNPVGAFLPPETEELEGAYRSVLREQHGIVFNRLLTMTNVPINRFGSYLKMRGERDAYLALLRSRFNPDVVKNLMCRSLLSVGYDGKLYDCDFNQALGRALKDKRGIPLTASAVNPTEIEGREIAFGGHCYACTAGSGSSCQGVLSDGI